MDRHRMGRGEENFVKLPRPVVPVFNLASFMLQGVPCANPLLACWQQELYRWAFAQAQAVAQPSILERDLLAVWN
jgi:hypothetical protein